MSSLVYNIGTNERFTQNNSRRTPFSNLWQMTNRRIKKSYDKMTNVFHLRYSERKKRERKPARKITLKKISTCLPCFIKFMSYIFMTLSCRVKLIGKPWVAIAIRRSGGRGGGDFVISRRIATINKYYFSTKHHFIFSY